MGRLIGLVVLAAGTAFGAEDGWEPLFDGRTSAGWVSVTNTAAFPARGWEIRDGALSVVPTRHFLPDGNSVPTNGGAKARGGDICTVRKFRDFHFKAEFRLTPRANGGFKYFYEPDRNGGTALEYQVLDPDYPTPPGTTAESFATKRVASAYLLYAADAEKYLKPCGEWNQAEIIARGRQVEHWLNGVKVVSFTRGSADFWSRFASTKWANAKYNADGDWGCAETGRIQLQDHQDAVSYRNLMIRELRPEPPQPFVLAKDGACQVRFDCGTTKGETFATNDFSRILAAVTGAKPNPSAPNAIVLRIDPALGPRDAFRVDSPDAKTLMVRASNSRSVVFAMDAVWEALGCRWFWPGQDGEYLPAPTKDLALPAGFVRAESTPFALRNLKGPINAASMVFFAHQRLNPLTVPRGCDYGTTTCWGGHSFGHIFPEDCKTIKEYHEKYPEQFALMNGIRVANQHCYTNPDTIRTFQDWICRFWEEHPDIEYLKLTPLDCPNHCHCADCAKMDASTAYYNFVNEIVKPAKAKYPQKNYALYAYTFYRPVPACDVDPKMILQYCLYNRCYKHGILDPDCPVNVKALVELGDWKRKLGHAPELFGYHWDVFGGAGQVFALPLARVLADEIRWAAKEGISYWHTEYPGKSERQVAQRYPAYIAAKLMWNPDADVKALTDDFCTRLFGPAAGEVAAYYALMENAWSGAGHLSYYGNSPAAIVNKLFTDELVARIDALWEKAEKKVSGREQKELLREKAGWLKWRELFFEKIDPEVWEMTVPKVAQAPNMDGSGTDPAWNAGKVVTYFKSDRTPKKVKRSEATVLHDGKALYLRFKGFEEDMEHLKLLAREPDTSVIASDDGIETYLDPNNTRTDYYWLCVNVNNLRIDALASVGLKFDYRWNGKWRTATSRHADHWIVEMELPFATFGQPVPGKPWLWGVNRSHTHYSWTDGAFQSPNSFKVIHLEGLN